MNLTITEEANRQLLRLLKEQAEPTPALRVAVTGQCGCGNLHFGLAWDRERRPDDIHLEYGELQLLIDPVSAPHLDHAIIDYHSDPFDSGFHIQVAGGGGCGCGHR